MMAHEPLVDRTFLEKLERLALHWRKSFPGLVGGRNPSRRAGSGQEFLDHRSFHHGDDLRAVNWRAFMRLEKLFLKLFQVEPRTPVRLLLDVSRSMATGGTWGPDSKFHYARKLAAALCYIGLVRLDTVNVVPFHSRLAEGVTASGGRHNLSPVVNFLTHLEPQERTDFLEVVRQFVSAFPQRGLVVVLSDFLDDAGAAKPLEYLGEFGHEIVLIHLWSEQDRRPPWDGELELVDAETGRVMDIAFDRKAQADYTAAFDRFSEELRYLAGRHGGRYVGLPIATSLEDAVFYAVSKSQGID